jgi:hypothetical protein
MFADDSTHQLPQQVKSPQHLTKLQSGSEWVSRNKLVLNIKSIVLETNHSLNLDPQLNIVMNNVKIEQVEDITLDCKLSWSKHTDATVATMGRGVSILKCCSSFLTMLSTRQVLQTLVLWHLDYCPVVWSGTTKNDVGKLQLAHAQSMIRKTC